jgi:hypothetical protein
MAEEAGNGNGQAGARVARLVLEFDLAAGLLRIAGEVPSNDTALDMLGRATRRFEMQARAEIMAEIAKGQIELARVQGILNRGGIRQ